MHDDDWPVDHVGFFLRRHSRLWVVPFALVVCGVVALVDYGPGQRLSCLLFYLAPVALAAWWGGFPAGVLLAAAAAVLRHLVCSAHGPPEPPVVRIWDLVVHFGAFALGSSLVARLQQALVRERSLARVDPLTGVANGRTFYERAGQEARRAVRTGAALTLAYLDVDNFKAVNDRRGHAAGDALLRDVADALRQHTRAHDLVARLGGDEFAMLLPGATAAGAAAAVCRLREALLRRMAARGWPVTFSMGAATFVTPPADVDTLVRQADQLMYRVKRSGKDRLLHETVSWPGELPAAERRAAARLLSGCAALVRSREHPEVRDWLATVRDISARGVGLRLECRLPDQTVLTVEPLPGCGARTLLARVVHAKADGRGWLHGCELAHHLSPEELREWLPSTDAAQAEEDTLALPATDACAPTPPPP
jgi:diguanylate cyclase (GGDEF)-like protein